MTHFIKRSLVFSLLAAALMAAITRKPLSTQKYADMKMNPGIITGKLADTKKFYIDVLKFSVQFETDWFILLQSPGGSSSISFLQPNHPSQRPIFQSAFNGKGMYLTIEVDDADKEYERMRSLKIPIEIEIRDEEWGDRHFAIVDPNGIGIDIVKYTAPE